MRTALAIVTALAAASCSGKPLSGEAVGTGTVTPAAGGVVALPGAGVRLEVPPGAVTSTTSITLRTSTAATPTGITADGPVVEFEPSGLVFAKPVTVTFAFERAVHPTVYWTNSQGDFEDLGGVAQGSTIVAQASHFSLGFVGELARPQPDAAPEGDAALPSDLDASIDAPAVEALLDGGVISADTGAVPRCPAPSGLIPGGWVNRTPAVLPASWPIARNNPAIAYDLATHKTVMSGGYGGPMANFFKDTWEWDGATWHELLVPGSPFDDGTAAAYDSSRLRMVLFSGFSRQLWEWSGAAGAWSNRTPAPLPASWAPMLSSALAAYDPDRRVFVLFDFTYGVNGSRTYEWDPAGGSWAGRVSPGPMGNGRGAFTWDPIRKRGVLVGGQTLIEVWEWEGATGKWSQRSPTAGAAWPSPRSGAVMTFDAGRGRPLLFGGTAPGGPFNPELGPPPPPPMFNELWEWDGDQGRWTELDDGRSAPAPPGRSNPSMVYDADRSCVILIGGGSLVAAADVWEWTRPRADGGAGPTGADAAGCDGGTP